jgi:Histidine phosphatase superfamily (branch 2)
MKFAQLFVVFAACLTFIHCQYGGIMCVTAKVSVPLPNVRLGGGMSLPRSTGHRIPQTSKYPYCGIDPGSEAGHKKWAKALSPPFTAPSSSSSSSSVFTPKLLQVQTLIRHGDRTNDGQCWPNDTARFECDMTHASYPNFDLSSSRTPVRRVYRKRYLPNREDNKGSNCGSYQLTYNGYLQEKANGEALRNAYVGTLLPQNYSAANIFLRTDDVPRTILSAESLFMG